MKHFIFITEVSKNHNRIGLVDNLESINNLLINEKLFYYNICLNSDNYHEIIKLFNKNYNKICDDDIYEGNILYMINDVNKLNHSIVNIDRNNLHHEFYYGKSNFFKINLINNKYIIHCNDGNIEIINKLYINNLINNRIIELNTIYDLDDVTFLDKIINEIRVLEIKNYDVFFKKNCHYIVSHTNNLSIKDKLLKLFSAILLNGNLPLQVDVLNEWNNYEIKSFNSFNHKSIKIIMINELLYELHSLKMEIPYIINYNLETKDYFFINIYYSSMGEDHEEINDIPKHLNKRENLFKIGEEPWNSEKNMLNYINKFNDIKEIYDLKNNLTNHKHIFL